MTSCGKIPGSSGPSRPPSSSLPTSSGAPGGARGAHQNLGFFDQVDLGKNAKNAPDKMLKAPEKNQGKYGEKNLGKMIGNLSNQR